MYGFYLAIGQQGSGKTVFITKLMIDNLKNKKRVFSNYTLFDVDYVKVTLSDRDNDLLKDVPKILDLLEDDPNYFNDSIILLDEMHLDLDSLDFMRKNNRRMQVFFSQLRKRNILLLGTTQYFMNVDIRIRRQCLNVFDMENIGKGLFRVTTNKVDGYYFDPISEYMVDLSHYFTYYDTNEIIY